METLARSPRPVVARCRTVSGILRQVNGSRAVRKSDLRCGDQLRVATENSVYSIRVLEGAMYSVRGGWFDRQGLSPVQTSIAGCTWGGSVIKNDIVAACGLHLEFGNRVVTSRIREIRVIRNEIEERLGLKPLELAELLSSCYGRQWQSSSAG